MPILSILILLPLLLLAVVLALSTKNRQIFIGIIQGVSVIQLLITSALWFKWLPTSEKVFNGIAATYHELHPWFTISLPALGRFEAKYFLLADGLSIPLLWMSTVVLVAAAFMSDSIKEKPKTYSALFLLLSSSVMGSFLAADMLLFYVFFEFMLLPMYFLIGYFGGKNREYASIKFFLYTLFGSLLILIAMLALNLSFSSSAIEQVHSFDVSLWYNKSNLIKGSLLDLQRNPTVWGLSARVWVFILLIIGFGIKIPIVPFHTWLPDAHVEAPAPVSAILAGILLKMGGYGILRFAVPVLPEVALSLSYFLGVIGLVAIIYGAFCALAQPNIKRLIAYSSISHMGFVVLGIASCTIEGIIGATYQMVSHGIISSLLFLLVGVLYKRSHDYEIDNYRGLMRAMPSFTGMFIIGIFAGMGLPFFSGFIGELLILMGTFNSQMAMEALPQWMTLVAILGIVLGSGYFLWAFQRMFFGNPWWRAQTEVGTILTDLTAREWLVLLPLCLLILFFGVYPQPLVSLIEPAAQTLIQQF